MRKEWRVLIIWLLLYCLLLAAVIFLPVGDETLMIRIVFNLTDIMILVLLGMIMVTDSVRLINGVTNEAAEAATPQERQGFVFAHLIRFAAGSVIYLAVSLLFTVLHFPWWPDLIVFMITTSGSAFSTFHIRL